MKPVAHELPMPDMSRLMSIEKEVLAIYQDQTSQLLPAVREELQDITRSVKKANQALRKDVTASLVTLNGDLEGLEQSATDDLDEQELLRSRGALQSDIQRLTQVIEAVQADRLPDLAAPRAAAEADIAQSATALHEVEQTIKSREASLAEIDSSLALLNAPSISRALRQMIPEDKDIDSILPAIKGPAASPELVKAAIAKLNQHLDLLEQGREYASVLKARNKMAQALDQEKHNLAVMQEASRNLDETVSQYRHADALLELRQQWLTQAQRFIEGWSVVDKGMMDAADSSALLGALFTARDYLLAIRRRIEAA